MKRACFAACVAALMALPAWADQPVTLRFSAEVDRSPFTCGKSYKGIGTTASTVEVADFRLYVTNMRLIAADGSETAVALEQDGAWQFANVALLDFEDATGTCVNGTPQVNTAVRGTVPQGNYTGVAFDIGVPFPLNHGDPTLAPSPLNLTAMFWNWQGGYKFVKIDLATAGLPIAAGQTAGDHSGQSKEGAQPKGWSLHLGSTGCASDSRTTSPAAACANPNLVTVRFDRFDTKTNVVVIDPAPVLARANVDHNTVDTSPGCMSFLNDDDCIPVMARLGLKFRDIAAGEQLIATKR